MKIKVPHTVVKDTVEVEVAFPFYRYHDVGGDNGECEYFTKIVGPAGPHQPPKQFILRRSRSWGQDDPTWECEVEPFRPHPREDPDYTLGRGHHELTAERWEQARAAFQQFVETHGFVVKPAEQETHRIMGSCGCLDTHTCRRD